MHDHLSPNKLIWWIWMVTKTKKRKRSNLSCGRNAQNRKPNVRHLHQIYIDMRIAWMLMESWRRVNLNRITWDDKKTNLTIMTRNKFIELFFVVEIMKMLLIFNFNIKTENLKLLAWKGCQKSWHQNVSLATMMLQAHILILILLT